MLNLHLGPEPQKIILLGTRYTTTIEWDRWEAKRKLLLEVEEHLNKFGCF